jgi:hypothetical protein
MQLDLFNEVQELEILSRLKKVEDALAKTRRSLFARINELEREVLELRKEEETELKIKNQ